MINTKKAPTRGVHYPDFEALKADLDRLEAAEQAGTLIQHGNWSLGRNAFHIADVIEQSIDGFRFTAPAPVRIIFSALKPVILRKPFPKGIRLKGPSTTLIPDESISTEQGLTALRTQIRRIDNGERMTQRSPIFGKLTHEQWIRLHCNHAELHLGFLDPGETPAA